LKQFQFARVLAFESEINIEIEDVCGNFGPLGLPELGLVFCLVGLLMLSLSVEGPIM